MKSPVEITFTHDTIIEMIKISGREILRIDEDSEIWTVYVKHGDYVVGIEHELINDFLTIVFYGEIQDEHTLTTINLIINENSGDFYFALMSTISYPFTSFSILHEEEQFTGFVIFTKIFPFDGDFSIRNLDAAIQNVLNASILGWAYLGYLLGGKLLQQKIAEMYKGSPDGMFW